MTSKVPDKEVGYEWFSKYGVEPATVAIVAQMKANSVPVATQPAQPAQRLDLALISIHSLISSSILIGISLTFYAFRISVTLTFLFLLIFALIVCVHLTNFLIPVSEYFNYLFAKKSSSIIKFLS